MEKARKKQIHGLRRPLAVAGFSLFSALAVLSLFGTAKTAAVLAAVCGLCFLLGCFRFFGRHFAGLCIVSGAALAGCLLFLCSLLFVSAPARAAQGTDISVSARVVSFPQQSANRKRYYVTARVTADGKHIPGKVRLSLPARETANCSFSAELWPGDTVTFRGTLYPLGGENSAVSRSFQSRRLFLGAYPTGKAERSCPAHAPLWACFLFLRQSAISALHSRFPGDTGGLLISLMFGDKTYLSANTYRAFRQAGAAHLLAVSGLHLSIWVLGLFTLFRRKNISLRVSALLCMGVTALVMASALFTGSVLRAGFMLLLFLSGALLRRESDGLNSLGFAVIVCLLIDPFLARNVGFLLSVLSTAALFLFAFPLSEKLISLVQIKRPRLRRLFGAVCVSVCISLCVTVVTAPVLLYFFGSVSLVGVLTNLLFLPLATPLLLCSALSALLGGLPLLGTAVCLLARLAALLAIRIVSLLSSLPFAALSAEKLHAVPALLCSLSLCAMLLVLLSGLHRAAKQKCAALAAFVFVGVAVSAAVLESGTARFVMLQAGQGSCVYLKQGSDAVLLRFDCGDYEAGLAVDTLEESGVCLRTAVLSGTENDAVLCDRLQPETTVLRNAGTETAVGEETDFRFGDFQVRVLQNGVLVAGRGQTFFLSDNNTLALSANSGIIHTDAAAAPPSTAKDALILTVTKNGRAALRGENDWHILMKSSSRPT